MQWEFRWTHPRLFCTLSSVMCCVHPVRQARGRARGSGEIHQRLASTALLSAPLLAVLLLCTQCGQREEPSAPASAADTNQPAALTDPRTNILLHPAVTHPALTNSAAGAAAVTPRPSGLIRPPIILILADGLGYGDLGCYGQAQVRTPNIDRLAAEGARFTSFYAGSPLSEPSRCALMTGRHTGHATVRAADDQPLGPQDVTLAEVLKGTGYRTCLTGEWLLGGEGSASMPHKKGFEEFAGFLTRASAQDYFPDSIRRYAPAILDPHSTPEKPEVIQPEFDGLETLYPNSGGRRGLYIQDLFTTAAMNFSRINQPTALNRYQPFFLCLACACPRPAQSGLTVPGDTRYSEQPWPQAEKNQALMITHLDDDVGKLMAALDNLKTSTNVNSSLANNAIVILTSDTGPHRDGGVDPTFLRSAGPFRGARGDLSEGGIRVPLIVRWPKWLKPGQVNDTPWAAWDLLPTLAEFAGTKSDRPLDGISMVPAIMGQSQTNRHEFFYWESSEHGLQQAARMGDWKALRLAPDKPTELYNLRTDPAEKNDAAKDNPAIVARFEEFFKTSRTNQVK
jgi:arylsulfatase A-like enzyme